MPKVYTFNSVHVHMRGEAPENRWDHNLEFGVCDDGELKLDAGRTTIFFRDVPAIEAIRELQQQLRVIEQGIVPDSKEPVHNEDGAQDR